AGRPPGQRAADCLGAYRLGNRAYLIWRLSRPSRLMAWGMGGAGVAGEVVTTGTRAADAARANAQQGTNSSTQDAERAEAAVAANVPEPHVLNGAPDPNMTPQPVRVSGIGTARAQRARVPAAPAQATDAAVPGVGVRRRLARLG